MSETNEQRNEDRGEKARGFHVEKSISVGHILTTIILIIAALGWASQTDKSIAVIADRQTMQAESIRRIESDAAANRLEIRDTLVHISDKLDRLAERVKH